MIGGKAKGEALRDEAWDGLCDLDAAAPQAPGRITPFLKMILA